MDGFSRVRESTGTATFASDDDIRQPKTIHLVLLFLSLLLVVPVVGFSIFKLQGPNIEREAYGNLSAIAELKGGQIESWLSERHGDGVTMMSNQSFIERVAGFQRTRDKLHPEHRQEIINKLKSRLQAYGYDAVLLLDTQGKPLLAVGNHNDVNDQTKALLPAAFASGQVLHSDLLLENSAPYMDFVVPLIIDVKGKQSAVGAVVLRTDPHQFLFPFIQQWPSASRSGETLLLRRDGESVLFLNELRHRKGTALTLRRPMSAPNFAGAVAIREARPGAVAGVDYRKVPVLAAYRPVAGTNWRIIAKLDRDEVLAPLQVLVFWVSLVAFIGVTSVSVAMLLLWRQQQRMQGLIFVAEKAKSDRLLQQFFDLPFIGMAIISPTTKRWVKSNERLCEILGYTSEELAGKTWVELTHSEDTQSGIAEFERMMRGKSEGFTQNKRYIRKDGTVVLADIDVKCVRKDDGTVDYLLVTIQDITERKKDEAKLSASVARFRAITQTATYAIITSDSTGKIVEWNEGAEATFGYTRAEAVGLPVTALMPQRFHDRHTTGLNRAQAGSEVVGKTVEFEGLTKSEDKFPLELTLSEWSTAEGRFFTAIIRDITERKRAEESLRKLSLAVEQSPSSIVITDLDANIEYVNEGFIKATGYSFAEAVGQNPRLLQSGKTTQATYDDMWAHLSRGETWKGELINRRKDGSEYIELVLISPVRQRDGGVTHFLAIKEDITQRKLAEAQLIGQVEELRRWHDTTMDREMRVLELKREVNELLGQAGQAPRYSSTDWQAE